MSTSIITVLKKDHRDVAELLKTAQGTSETAHVRRADLLEKITSALKLHMEFEEKHIYPLLLERQHTKRDGLEAAEEHRQVRFWLRDIANCDVSDERWAAKIMVLTEGIKHHVHEEEQDGGLFDDINEILSTEQLAKLSDSYVSMKDNKESGHMHGPVTV